MIVDWFFRVIWWLGEQNDGLTAVVVLLVGVMTVLGTLLVGVMTLLGTLGAAAAALYGVKTSAEAAARRSEQALDSADKDRRENAAQNERQLEQNRRQQEALESREQKESRHGRLSMATEQLGSDNQAVRIGGLHSLSALADEWDQEARYLIRNISTGQDHANSVDASLGIKPLDRRGAHFVGQNALSQRNACIDLICAYLRGAPIGSTLESRSPIRLNQLPLPHDPSREPDWDARANAFSIIADHCSKSSPNPWPGYMIKLDGADLRGFQFNGCDMPKASFKRTRMDRVRIIHSNMRLASFEQASMGGFDTSHANFEGGDFTRARLDYASISESDLSTAEFKGATLTGVNMFKSTMMSTSFESAVMPEAQIKNCEIYKSRFNNARLVGFKMSGIGRISCDFSGASLDDAIFSSTDLKGSIFMGAKINGTHFSHSGFGEDWIESFVPNNPSEGMIPDWNIETLWPEGFDPQEILIIAVERGIISSEAAASWADPNL